MTRKTLLAAALAAGSLLGAMAAAQAAPAVVAPPGAVPPGNAVYQPGIPIYIDRGHAVIVQQPAPPAPVAEAVPAPRAGYVWSPGHYEWRGDRYVWIAGEWMSARAGYGWRPGHWEQRGDGNWQFVAGHWERDDGYASYDRDARRGPFGDRDGDGVINRDDRYPRDSGRY